MSLRSFPATWRAYLNLQLLSPTPTTNHGDRYSMHISPTPGSEITRSFRERYGAGVRSSKASSGSGLIILGSIQNVKLHHPDSLKLRAGGTSRRLVSDFLEGKPLPPFPIACVCLAVLVAYIPLAAAQAPNTDFAAWPSGLLTLVTSLYIGTTLATSVLEENDPVSCVRPLGLLDFFTGYLRSHDHLGTVKEIWLEPANTLKAGSDDWSAKTEWQKKVQYSAYVARIRGEAAVPVVASLRVWATDPARSVERIHRSAREWDQRFEGPASPPQTENADISAVAANAGAFLAESFRVRLESYTPTAEEFSLICQGLAQYSDCAAGLSFSEDRVGHTRDAEARRGLAAIGLGALVNHIRPVESWFAPNDNPSSDTVRGLFIALEIRRRYLQHQTTRWTPETPTIVTPDIEKGTIRPSPSPAPERTIEDLVEALTSRSAELMFTWRPFNFAGNNRSISLLAFVWGVRHFGSDELRAANPAELITLSLFSGVGTVYKALGCRFLSQKCPTTPDSLADNILSFVEEPMEEIGSWVGVLPITQILYYGRLSILLIIVAFFVSLGSGASAWMCLGLCLGVLPRDDPLEYPELRAGERSLPFPWPAHTVRGLTQPSRGLWLIGMEGYKPYHGLHGSPPLVVILLGLASTNLAHAQQLKWRAALNFGPWVPPAKWIIWTSIGLSMMMGVVQLLWYARRATGHGPASRREGLLATRLAMLSGTTTIVICVLRAQGILGPYARWIAEATLCTTTLPLFVLYPDGPGGEREGGCRILYMWQWLLAGSVSLISSTP